MIFFKLPDVSSIMTTMINNIAAAFPNIIAALFIVIVGIIISKLVTTGIRKILEKLQIDKLGNKLNEIDMVSKANTEIKLSKIFSKALYYFLVLFFMVAAADTLQMPAVSAVFSDIFNFFPKLLVALIIIVIGMLLAEFFRSVLETTMKSLGIPSATMIANFFFYFLFINIVIVALSQAEINTDFLSQNISLIIGGIVFAFALAYGIASKDVVANYIASFYATKNVNIGDRITVDGVHGIVKSIDKATVTIQSESSLFIIPLRKVMNEKIEIHH